MKKNEGFRTRMQSCAGAARGGTRRTEQKVGERKRIEGKRNTADTHEKRGDLE